ncbi:MAG TPA: cyclic nucleotide-binding domain-containing protein [Rhodocyclaceae bacterium]|nr:cyclic nucleotide-binding domain-containing protein [Rhodocyclaceae bacterium]
MDTVTAEQLGRFHPLASLGKAALRELVPLCHVERVARNLDPFRMRDWEGQAVFLLKGQLKLEVADGSVSVLVGSTGDALLPLCGCGHEPVATRAITAIELLHFDEDTLDIFLTWDQLTAPARKPSTDEVETADWRNMSGIFALQNLTQGVFATLPPAHIQSLFERFQRVKVKRDQVVVREGDPGDFYYLIERGRCQVTRRVAGDQLELAELAAGDAFGEEALIAETRRNATVTMKTPGVLLRLSKADFIELLREPLLHRVDFAEAARRVAGGAVWLDVRFAAEYQHDGLAGAINIPPNELREAVPMLDRGKDYIAYCQTGRRSSAAAFLLSQRGIRAFLLDGGLKAVAAAKERKAT